MQIPLILNSAGDPATNGRDQYPFPPEHDAVYHPPRESKKGSTTFQEPDPISPEIHRDLEIVDDCVLQAADLAGAASPMRASAAMRIYNPSRNRGRSPSRNRQSCNRQLSKDIEYAPPVQPQEVAKVSRQHGGQSGASSSGTPSQPPPVPVVPVAGLVASPQSLQRRGPLTHVIAPRTTRGAWSAKRSLSSPSLRWPVLASKRGQCAEAPGSHGPADPAGSSAFLDRPSLGSLHQRAQ